MLRRIAHMLVLLALVLGGWAEAARMPRAMAPASCPCGCPPSDSPDCPCGMPSKAPAPSCPSGPSLAPTLALVAAQPSARPVQPAPRREPAPMPPTRVGHGVRLLPASRLLAWAWAQRPPPRATLERLTLLATFRI